MVQKVDRYFTEKEAEKWVVCKEKEYLNDTYGGVLLLARPNLECEGGSNEGSGQDMLYKDLLSGGTK